MNFTQGKKVLVVYPYDSNWWEVEGYISEQVDDDLYSVVDIETNRVIQIPSMYIRTIKN
ncbi:hypothetical protein QU593_10150 [Rossellomorea marisflavi]|uniref:hypothetical protein n=1 Tax=Rossellomorea marisflavi TaxID=189381 RepID=UPI0025B14515|nr:hypothetical protein [Rossellomorea marisflavi]WJV20766.1 hypothetical protein QU593_10150 [Rossellomorea marisflavi]